MYGDSYVVNLFKQNVYHKKNDIFATVTLKQQFFCHGLTDNRHCTNRLFINVLEKICLRSLAGKNVGYTV